MLFSLLLVLLFWCDMGDLWSVRIVLEVIKLPGGFESKWPLVWCTHTESMLITFLSRSGNQANLAEV